MAIDLFCGLGGWTEGLLAEGFDVVGFDIERREYLGQLVIQDVMTLHGSRFKDAALIVASPPCQGYSYRAMPWSRAKALPPPDNSLFEACFRIQREASEAAGYRIPMVVENVRGAQKWVGRAKWHYGSFYLWGDVPALMPMVTQRRMKFPADCSPRMWKDRVTPRLNDGTVDPSAHAMHMNLGTKGVPHKPTGHWTNPAENGIKQGGIGGLRENGKGDAWFQDGAARHGSKSSARKHASAMIAKIPYPLASHIAQVFKPKGGKA